MELFARLSGLTTEVINEYPEVKAYRMLYKEMGVDWHSRRPSPEALLRRISQGKDLYTINTCVDSYNLVVMDKRISIGAFDLDTLSLPTVLRRAKDGEEILLLGDSENTKYKSSELAYFDQIGGYNIDFNYRDAIRAAVTGETKNIMLNVDGVYGITPQQVSESLHLAAKKIIHYCGGEIESIGVVTATD
jgi:DNA/RNA-binding domain of Phe-tRNA-synthetase-like protein